MVTAAPHLLLIHGFGCDARFWHPQVTALRAAGHDVLAPDLPYHGGPTAGVARSLQGLAGWVAAEAAGVAGGAPAVLVGHSLGGMIALQVAHQRPDLVAGIALIDAFVCLASNSRYLPSMFVAPPEAPVREWIERTRRDIVARMTGPVHDAIWPSVAAFDAGPWLADIRCPVLGVYGGRGRYTRDDASRLREELLLDRLGGAADVVVIPDAGHFVNLEGPAETNAALARWLSSAFGD